MTGIAPALTLVLLQSRPQAKVMLTSAERETERAVLDNKELLKEGTTAFLISTSGFPLF